MRRCVMFVRSPEFDAHILCLIDSISAQSRGCARIHRDWICPRRYAISTPPRLFFPCLRACPRVCGVVIFDHHNSPGQLTQRVPQSQRTCIGVFHGQKLQVGIAWCLRCINVTVSLLYDQSMPANQQDQAPQRLHLSCRRQQWTFPYVPSAALSRNLVNAAAALVVVLGSRDVEMLATRSSIIHGWTGSRLANVSSGEHKLCGVSLLRVCHEICCIAHIVGVANPALCLCFYRNG